MKKKELTFKQVYEIKINYSISGHSSKHGSCETTAEIELFDETFVPEKLNEYKNGLWIASYKIIKTNEKNKR